MKQTLFISIFLFTFFGSLTNAAVPTLVEVDVDQVFIPQRGYDDNDNVEIVVTGELPNPCFTLGETKINRPDPQGKFIIHQFAWLSKEGNCGQGDLIEDPVPFSTTASLGMLDSVRHEVEFRKPSSQKGQRQFMVEVASSSRLDNFDYASLTQIEMEDDIYLPGNVTAEVKGVLTSSCSRLAKPQILYLGDVVVVLPIVESTGEAECLPTKTAFNQKVDLGKLPQGKYLLQARSRNGKALHHTFGVYGKR